MTFEIEASTGTRVVDITGMQGRYRAVVDGRAWAVDAARIGGSWSLLVGARSYDVTIVEQGAGDLIVHVNGRAVPVSVPALDWRRRAGRRRRRDEQGAETSSGPHRVVAPMPGRIVKLLVKPGDLVAARQGLVVVEAMKMENELRSARAGTVREVRVAQGASVEANTVLVVIE